MSLLTAIGLSMISTLFAYDGWQFVSLVAGEIRDPQRNIPRSIVLGVLIVMVIYVSANLAYIYVLGQDRIATSQRVAADAMSAMVGPAGATFITVTILCSTFGAMSANILAGPRVFFAMARDGVFFRQLSSVHAEHGTPANAIWALAAWSGLLTLTGGYEHLITMSQFANWLFFTMVVLSVVVLRRRHPEWTASVQGHGVSAASHRVRAGVVGVRPEHAGRGPRQLRDGPRPAAPGSAVLSEQQEESGRVTFT